MRSTRHKDEESFIVDEIKGAKLISKLIKKLKPRLLYFTFFKNGYNSQQIYGLLSLYSIHL